jgi:transposase
LSVNDGILQRVTHAAADLPNLNTLDSDALKALVLEKHALIIEQQAALTSRNHEIENLRLLILKLKRMKFGRSSEKLDRQIEQLELRLEDLETADAANDTASSASQRASNRCKGTRGPLPGHLPRETQTHAPKHEVCPDCGGTLNTLGEDVSEIFGVRAGALQGDPDRTSEMPM